MVFPIINKVLMLWWVKYPEASLSRFWAPKARRSSRSFAIMLIRFDVYFKCNLCSQNLVVLTEFPQTNQNILMVCLHCHLFGIFRRIDDGQMDGETEGQVNRKCNRATYKPTYIPQLPSANKAQGKHMHFAQTK